MDKLNIFQEEKFVPTRTIFLVVLVLVTLFFYKYQSSNPYKKYSTTHFWKQATVTTVQKVPEEALKPGNRNGSVLMWAAMGTPDIAIIQALVDRGADVNESDPLYTGTPLSAAAGYGRTPKMITELVRLGGDVNKTVSNDETPLMIAARYNHQPGFVEALVAAGAKVDAKSAQGATALDIAIRSKNTTVKQALIALENNASEPH
ncbi:MAG: ankyrin repeat domain-containing protein [Burkholderiales bacterium]|jgi:ankyrin repeat protein|nr:ankyrin repeat domain-containing protein [Burkholderiales bacterium]